MPIVYVFGNPIYPQDEMAVLLLPLLRQYAPDFTFIHKDPTEELDLSPQTHMIIIDTVIGLSEARLFRSFDEFERSPRNTAHDFDVPTALGLLKKLNKVDSVSIIGVPSSGDPDELVHQVISLLRSI